MTTNNTKIFEALVALINSYCLLTDSSVTFQDAADALFYGVESGLFSQEQFTALLDELLIAAKAR